VVSRPDHGITVATGFRIVMTQRARLPELEPVLPFLPLKDQPVLAAKIEKQRARA